MQTMLLGMMSKLPLFIHLSQMEFPTLINWTSPFGFSPGSALFAKIKTIIVLDPLICTMTDSMWKNSILYTGLKISVHS